ncbi:hypothetical protein PIB30_014751 [Stylosanthes scabra]|uniref:Uncharacterized protein n=1 Tax=Stylosanthes scabra TaxID=79078 RepID=A0ABU6X8P5_9FABA|nr:hypothetical protein [Stylosanthes scabra]
MHDSREEKLTQDVNGKNHGDVNVNQEGIQIPPVTLHEDVRENHASLNDDNEEGWTPVENKKANKKLANVPSSRQGDYVLSKSSEDVPAKIKNNGKEVVEEETQVA